MYVCVCVCSLGWSDNNLRCLSPCTMFEWFVPAYAKLAAIQTLTRDSSVCISYMTRTKSGTGYTVRYAREEGLQIINLADPFYSESNMRELKRRMYAIENGTAVLEEHELIEIED